VHLELSWLVATGRVLDEMLLNWKRRAEKMGITIVDAPYYQSHPGQDEWPLQSLLYIPLAVPPPSTASLVTAEGNDVPSQLFFEEIARAHDFVLDFGTSACPGNWHNVGARCLTQNHAREAHSLLCAEGTMNRPTRSRIAARFKRAQYIHRSGRAIVQVVNEDGRCGFLFEKNRFHTFRWARTGWEPWTRSLTSAEIHCARLRLVGFVQGAQHGR